MTFSFGMVGSAVHALAAPPAVAQFISPVIGSATLGLTQPFQWTTSPVAAAYYLSVGSSAGNGDVFTTFVPASQSSWVIPPLPHGEVLWARIWTEIPDYGWYHGQDVSFTIA
ncbi:MAG: hypothetical protein M3256_05785 [Actinomycetota bacterium]|nr:hypothetical protein [Actinomycetota bacterium]